MIHVRRYLRALPRPCWYLSCPPIHRYPATSAEAKTFSHWQKINLSLFERRSHPGTLPVNPLNSGPRARILSRPEPKAPRSLALFSRIVTPLVITAWAPRVSTSSGANLVGESRLSLASASSPLLRVLETLEATHAIPSTTWNHATTSSRGQHAIAGASPRPRCHLVSADVSHQRLSVRLCRLASLYLSGFRLHWATRSLSHCL